jgi:hypothetical protein
MTGGCTCLQIVHAESLGQLFGLLDSDLPIREVHFIPQHHDDLSESLPYRVFGSGPDQFNPGFDLSEAIS